MGSLLIFEVDNHYIHSIFYCQLLLNHHYNSQSFVIYSAQLDNEKWAYCHSLNKYKNVLGNIDIPIPSYISTPTTSIYLSIHPSKPQHIHILLNSFIHSSHLHYTCINIQHSMKIPEGTSQLQISNWPLPKFNVFYKSFTRTWLGIKAFEASW
jgi:hypothetical protein